MYPICRFDDNIRVNSDNLNELNYFYEVYLCIKIVLEPIQTNHQDTLLKCQVLLESRNYNNL